MNDLLKHPWVKVLVIATAIAMCSFALRETASITQPVVQALYDVLVPVAIGFAVAYVLTPLVDWLQRRGFSRLVATGMLFCVVAAAGVVTLLLVVPGMIRQSVDLSVKVFQGEPFTDLNQNGRWDPGEPFTDRNHNGQYDPALFSRGAVWLEEHQNRLKSDLNLALSVRALGYLGFYRDELQPQRAELDQVVADLRAAPGTNEHVQAEPAPAVPWGWPGLSDSAAKQVLEHLPLAARDTAGARLGEAQTRLITKHDEILAAIVQSQAQPSRPVDPLVERARQMTTHTAANDERKRVLDALVRELEAAEKQREVNAQRMLALLRGTDGQVGSQTLAALVSRFEESARGMLEQLPSAASSVGKSAFSGVNNILATTLSVLLLPIYAFFLVIAMPQIRIAARDYIPLRFRDQTMRILRDIERVVAAFFRGRLIISTVCAVVGGLSMLLIGVPYGLLFGVCIGLATAIPLAGLLFLLPAIALALLEPGTGLITVTLIVGVYVVVQTLETALIPVVMGKEVELHPVTLIISLLLLGKLLGILGLILAVPIAATCRILAPEFLWPRWRAWAAQPTAAMPIPPAYFAPSDTDESAHP